MTIISVSERERLELLATRRQSRSLRPFLRWAGSKQALLKQIVPHLPSSYGTYFEPFLGGGALALLLAPKSAVLSDSGTSLMEAWFGVQRDCEGVLAQLQKWDLSKEEYYSIRAMDVIDPTIRAARFIYLNRGAFNGLWRVNSSGSFNVPWGAPKSKLIVEPGVLRAVSGWLNSPHVELFTADFEASIDKSACGDFVFADPPYHAMRADGRDFKHYSQDLFGWSDQIRLVNALIRARERGVYVLMTNSAAPEIADLVADFVPVDLLRHSTLAASGSARRLVKERLYVGRPLS